MTTTYAQALSQHGTKVPDHLVESMEVPIGLEDERQGDLYIHNQDGEYPLEGMKPLKGLVQIVYGEATGNTHYLQPNFDMSSGVTYKKLDITTRNPNTCMLFHVPAGQSVLVSHTEEHGANGFGPGFWKVNRKMQLEGLIQD